MELATFDEQVFFSTVRVVSIGANQSASLGTAFLVRIPVLDGLEAILAVSNKHVLLEPSRHLVLEFTKSIKSLDGERPDLGNKLRLGGNLLQDNYYFEHADPSVDLACFNVSRLGGDGVYFRPLSMEMAATFTENWLIPNREVCFVGYPDGRYDERNNLPILRRGVIASIPKVDYEGEKQFLIDAQVYQGSSGSPVFMTESALGGQVKFIGVLNAGMRKHSKLQKLPVNLDKFGIEQTIGLGFVLKPALVQEMLDDVAAKLKKANQPLAAIEAGQ